MINSFYDFFSNDFFLNGFSAFLGGIISGGCAIWGAKLTLNHQEKEKLPDKVVDLVELRRDILAIHSYIGVYLKGGNTALNELPGYSDSQHSMLELIDVTLQKLLRVAVRVDTHTYNAIEDLIDTQLEHDKFIILYDLHKGSSKSEENVYSEAENLHKELFSSLYIIDKRLNFYRDKLKSIRLSKRKRIKKYFVRNK